MKLGDIANVGRGISTGNRALFIMTRRQARDHELENFVRPVLNSVRDFPKSGRAVVHDHPDRQVVLIVSARDCEQYTAVRTYLRDVVPRVSIVRTSPIAASYTGIPRFVENPDGLVITNSLYRVTPRHSMSTEQIRDLVARLNAAMGRRSPAQRAERWTPRQMESLEI
ncbi:MAG: hypothetical protein ACRENA_05165 [Vulcanimicrobiaceae bacterium]